MKVLIVGGGIAGSTLAFCSSKGAMRSLSSSTPPNYGVAVT